MRERSERFISLPYQAWRVRRACRRIPDLLVRCIAAIMKIPFAPGMAIPLLGAAGLIGAAGYSWTLPDQFVSTTVVGIGDNYIVGVDAEAEKIPGLTTHWWFTNREALVRRQEILGRSSLAPLITRVGLYKEELKTRPVEDLVQQMEESDVRISPVAGSRHMFSITVKAPEAAGAQGAAQSLAASFIDGTDFSIKEPANLPAHPEGPRRLQIALIGLGEVRWPRC